MKLGVVHVLPARDRQKEERGVAVGQVLVCIRWHESYLSH